MTKRSARLALVAGGAALLAAGLTVSWWGVQRREARGPMDARALYERDCAVCHGTTGKGDGPGARVVGQRMPDFTDAEAMRRVDDRFLFQIIQKGGSQFGRSNAMPAWGMKLSDAEIQALVELIRSFARPPRKEAS